MRLDQIHFPVMCVVPDTKIAYHALVKQRQKYMYIKLGTMFCFYFCYYYLMQEGVPNESNAKIVFWTVDLTKEATPELPIKVKMYGLSIF